MQQDSVPFSTSGHMMHSEAQEPTIKALQCVQCTLIFKSKVYLFEHLNKVHGFDVESALSEAGLKHHGTKANPDNLSSSSENVFLCQHCDFQSSLQDVLNQHKKHCQKKHESPNGTVDISGNPEMKLTAALMNQQKEDAEEISSSFSEISTSKAKCTPSLSKDVKPSNSQLQTITKYFTSSLASNGKPPVKLADASMPLNGNKETLVLQESPSSSCGVYKVTAKSMIDIPRKASNLKSLKPNEKVEEIVTNNVVERASTERSEGPPAKKAKSCKEETKPARNTNASKQQLSSSANFSFELSKEDEERVRVLNGDTESSKMYFCKHCDYNSVNIKDVSMHYHNEHPCVNCNVAYIQDPQDQSATFRCLECPVEFVSVPDLKKHYMENHPEAPDVFTLQSCELSLIFKCFVCHFTTTLLKTLKEHYVDMHQTYEVDNPLLYFRYSASRWQKASSLLNTCEKAPSPERPDGSTPEGAQSPCKGVKNPPIPQHSISRGADVALYHCNSCNFSHKSAVVMHVHYQKNHPDEPVTIDRIKLASTKSKSMTTENTPNTIKENSTPQKDITESSTKAYDKAKLSHQKVSLSLMNSKQTSEACDSETPNAEKMESAEDRSVTKTSLTSHKRELSTGMDGSLQVIYCRFCSYSSYKIRSVLGHCNAKHIVHGTTSIEELLQHTAELQKKKLQSEAKASANTSSSDAQTTEQHDAHSGKQPRCEEDDVADASMIGFHLYKYPEKLFYCQKCNFGNPSLKGVLNHQSKIHRRLHSNKECILKHTALLHKEIKKSSSHTKESRVASHLPLPLMNEGDENCFFCHFCNYRHSTLNEVLRHYFKRHPEVKGKAELIRRYTSLVLEETQKSHLKRAENKGSNHATLENKKNTKKTTNKLAKCFSVSVSPSLRASQTQRILQCYRCSYTTQVVYLLRRHMWKIHRSNRSCNDVLRTCFNQGNLQSGYHCHLCVFSHTNAATVYKHCQNQHPGQKVSFEYVSTHLYVGPRTTTPKREKPQPKHTNDASDGTDGAPSFGENETKTYSCKACSFKGSSITSITQHYRAVHPWSVKEDGSVLGVVINKKRIANSQLENHHEIPESFETYQIPLEFDQSMDTCHEQAESSGLFKCSHCTASFHTWHSLSTHCGMKHKGAATENSDEQQELQIQMRVHVFKCPHCPYINSNYQGVLTHCQMKHPALVSRANSLHVDKRHLQSLDECLKTNSSGDNLRYRGYMCKTCHHIYATPEKLNKHCKTDHKKTALMSNTPKPAPEPTAVSKIKQNLVSNSHSTRGSVSKASFLCQKKYAEVKCQLCSYSFSTKIGLSRHILVHHRNPSIIVKDCAYKCLLCTRSYSKKKRLGSHYAKKHGRDAFLKYYAPVHKPQKSPSHPLTQQPETTSEAFKSSTTTKKTKVLIYKCPTCPYVNASYHGILTHCQMIHPDLVVRADELQTDEILVTNMIECTLGKGANERGYMCKKCPQIHASIVKLKSHCKRDHGQAELAASENSNESQTEEQRDYASVGSALEAASLKTKTSAVKKKDPSQQLGSPRTCQSSARPVPNKEPLYKCYMCTYTGSCRKYLYCHYKHTHKLDALRMYKLLERYNKRKRKAPSLTRAEYEETAPVKCKKCLRLTFESSRHLIAHYSGFHRSDCKFDFTVLSQRTQRSTGIYRCAHCKKQINGIKNLSSHLDRHRAYKIKKAKAAERQASFVSAATPEARSSELCRQDELPLLETVEELAQWNVTPVQTFTLPASPVPSPSKPTDPEQPEGDSRQGEHSCKQCRRTFMSLKGLRSHERSHAALAAIKNLDNLPLSALKHNINKYLIYKSGTLRPFLCSICSFRTTVLGLWKSHFMKKHQDYLMDTGETRNKDEESSKPEKESLHSTDEIHNSPEPDEQPEMTEKSLYLEPPDVQRQLTHYSLMAQIGVSSKENLHETVLSENSLLHCELCNFSTGHQSSMRRHYLNRHGRKLLRCKDCDFVTGIRKTLEMHMQTGHSTFQSEATHLKDLRCPFCLYQTKNKNNMIDHIVLHREERVVPIEVRRPKLSHYLQGIVFRCHKCTFTSSSAENLHLHMMRHNDVRPYRCRLCYFDCTHLSDLEGHLSDKHQVVRNHELVGQVSLDQLEATVDMTPVQKGERLFNLQQHNSDHEDGETEELVTDCSELLHEILTGNLTENDFKERTSLQMREAEQKHAEEPIKQAGVGFLSDAANVEGIKTAGKGWNAVIQSEYFSGPVKPLACGEKTEKTQAQDIIKAEKPTSVPSCAHLKRSPKGNLEVSLVSCKAEVHIQKNSEEVTNSYKEMPVLQNAPLKEEMQLLECCKEEEDTDIFENEQPREDGMIIKDNQKHCKDYEQEEGAGKRDSSPTGAAAGGAALVLHTSVGEKKLYTCELCGRNLLNNCELERHIMRHGM
ncbi:Zinc finger protein 462 [Channa argus]|uniref:Zinc finger protein 462 n=1 Tax=Channa argus TaxID=215402 RepID=A0A6G1PZC6_CHAAH|nr:Zinc finger protein 462 [Channa argus]